MWEAALTVMIFAVAMFVFCSCCRMCARQHELQRAQRQMQMGNRPNQRVLHRERVLVAVIPTSIDGRSTPPHFDSSYWGAPPPPYSPTAPTATIGTCVHTPPTPTTIGNRLQTASPPPQYESPPPYL